MITTAPGKIVIGGEFAVLDGYKALAAAVNRRAVAQPATTLARSPFLLELGRRVAAGKQERHWPVRVDTDSMKWHRKKLGLGSSAACVVSAARLAFPEFDETQLLELCLSVHRKVQGEPGGSGVDIGASVRGGVITYELVGDTPRIENTNLPADLYFSFLFSGESSKTTDALSTVHILKRADESVYQARMKQIAEAACLLIDSRSGDGFVEGLGEAREAAIALGKDAKLVIETDVHRKAAQLARECGGQAKSTGAGGGDIILAAFANVDAQQWFQKQCQAAQIVRLDLAFDEAGARIESDAER